VSGTAADGVLVSERANVPVGASPWALARRRLRRNRIAMAMLGVFLVIVLACLAAPLYAR
jgi:Tfp pilus assembly protein PilN